MKWNNKASFLLEEFTTDLVFLSDVTAKYQESRSKDISKFSKKIFKNLEGRSDYSLNKLLPSDDKTINLVRNQGKSNKSLEMQFNSNFLYAFTIFEKFIADLIKLKFNDCKRFRERPINTLIEILKIEDYDDKIFRDCFFFYTEARERRNLMTHRGKIFDDEYLKRLNHYTKKNKYKSAEKVLLQDHFLITEKKFNNISELLGVNANTTPEYFSHVIQTLLYLGCAFHSTAFRLSKTQMNEQGHCYITNTINRTLCFSIDNDYKGFFSVNKPIWDFFLKCNSEIEFREYGYFDQVNYCLMKQYGLEVLSYLNKEKGLDNEIPKDLDYLSMIKCNNPKYEKHHKLAVAYFKNDISGVIAATKEIIAAKEEFNVSKSDLKEWFLFKRLAHKRKIKKFLNSEDDE